MAGTLNLNKYSMMSKTPAYSIGDSVVFGLRAVVIPPDPVTDRVITTELRHTGRPDLLAYELYGSTDLWWVVADANQLIDPVVELVSGMELTVPTKARVLNTLAV